MKQVNNNNQTDETSKRRVQHIYQWLNPNEAKEWMGSSEATPNKQQQSQSTSSSPNNIQQLPWFPSSDEIREALNDDTNEFIQQIQHSRNAGLIRELDQPTKEIIWNTLNKNHSDVTSWSDAFFSRESKH